MERHSDSRYLGPFPADVLDRLEAIHARLPEPAARPGHWSVCRTDPGGRPQDAGWEPFAATDNWVYWRRPDSP